MEGGEGWVQGDQDGTGSPGWVPRTGLVTLALTPDAVVSDQCSQIKGSHPYVFDSEQLQKERKCPVFNVHVCWIRTT